ncbi:TPA: hypothetical protein ACQVH3_004671 [Serratia marcescens]
MDNKLSELSKPVAWEVKGILCHSEEEARVYVGEPEPLYSQEYVSALLADRDAWQASTLALRDELRVSKAIANEYQQLMYHMDAGGDFYEFQRDKAMKEHSNG